MFALFFSLKPTEINRENKYRGENIYKENRKQLNFTSQMKEYLLDAT